MLSHPTSAGWLIEYFDIWNMYFNKLRLCVVAAFVIAACTNHEQSFLENPFGNALIPDMIADASITEFDGTFYCYASSSRSPLKVRYFTDSRCQRTEFFDPSFAFDGANGSRWMAAEGDSLHRWVVADLGSVRRIGRSELYFVRPTGGHAYVLEGSLDGHEWVTCGGHDSLEKRSPHTDVLNVKFRYLRVRIQKGEAGIWEWKMYR